MCNSFSLYVFTRSDHKDFIVSKQMYHINWLTFFYIVIQGYCKYAGA